MASPICLPVFHVTDPVTGMPLNGGLVWTYDALNPASTIASYKNWSPAGGYYGLNANPIVLDGNGDCNIFLPQPALIVVEGPPPVGQTHGSVLYTIPFVEGPPFNSYLVVGSVVPPTPLAGQLGLYCGAGDNLFLKNSSGVITAPATAQAIQQQAYIAASAGGTGDAITANFTPPVTSWIDKSIFFLTALAANNTTTPTFSANGLSPVTIVKGSNTALVAGDIPGANAIILLEYNSTLNKCVLLNPAFPFSPPKYATLQNRQPQNTAGGTATSGSWLPYPINVEYEDPNNIVDSTALPAFSLGAGTYMIEGFAPFFNVVIPQLRLYNVTDGAIQNNINAKDIIGSINSGNGSTATSSEIRGTFTLAGTKQLRVEYQVYSTYATQGLGVPGNFGEEIYGQFKITKLS